MSIRFYDSRGKHGCFSNFWTIPDGLVYRDRTYPTTEHAFQAAKFNYEGASADSMEYADIILQASTPNKARILAHQKTGGGYPWRTALNPIIVQYQHVVMRANWRDLRDDIMLEILREKFNQCEFFRTTLLATGVQLIQENSPRDSYWGIGKDETGLNRLGFLLMRVRDDCSE